MRGEPLLFDLLYLLVIRHGFLTDHTDLFWKFPDRRAAYLTDKKLTGGLFDELGEKAKKIASTRFDLIDQIPMLFLSFPCVGCIPDGHLMVFRTHLLNGIGVDVIDMSKLYHGGMF